MKTVELTGKQKDVMSRIWRRANQLELEKIAFDREFKNATDLLLDAHGLSENNNVRFDPNALVLLVED